MLFKWPSWTASLAVSVHLDSKCLGVVTIDPASKVLQIQVLLDASGDSTDVNTVRSEGSCLT